MACLVVGLLLAMLLDQRIKGEGLFRTIFMFPLAISFIVTGVAWRWLETPAPASICCSARSASASCKNGWFTDPNIGILGVVLAAFWQMSGYVMALYLAGLRGIPDDIARGGPGGRRQRVAVVPPRDLAAAAPDHPDRRHHPRPHLAQDLRPDRLDDRPGAGFATDVPALFMYQTTFFGSHFSQGAAVAMVLLLLVSVLIVPYLIYNARNEVQR